MKRISMALLFSALALMVATPALAEYSLYGSARMATYLTEGTGFYDADSDVNWELQSNSRIGGKFNHGAIGGRFEFGTGVNVRLLYGTWDFGKGTVVVGQDYTPYIFSSWEVANVDNGFAGLGDTYDGRQPQIRVDMENGFFVAAIKNNAQELKADREEGSTDDYDFRLPKLAVGYMHDVGYMAYGATLAYQTFDLNNDSVDSYMAAFNWKTNAGSMALQGNLFYGQNLGDFGMGDYVGDGFGSYDEVSDEDASSYGGYVQAAQKFGKVLGVVGVGYQADDSDAYAEKDEQFGYFVQAHIPLAENFNVIPHYTVYDLMDDVNGNDEGDLYFAGIKWQIDF
ncbi:MAG: hypothetical protein SCI25_03320 [Desulfuromonadales bacterium]|nr:hypothetical protein [Desulfuromonadales bacterium]MDW7758002.1 hypothetical protein [Desulfuromonadales bacterium]